MFFSFKLQSHGDAILGFHAERQLCYKVTELNSNLSEVNNISILGSPLIQMYRLFLFFKAKLDDIFISEMISISLTELRDI